MSPRKITVRRSELRRNQRALFQRAKGKTVLVVKSPSDGDDGKYVVSQEYFEQLCASLESAVETLEIAMDRRLFNQILAAADTVEEDLRSGRLHSLEEAFGEA
jgi:hypothetical protein